MINIKRLGSLVLMVLVFISCGPVSETTESESLSESAQLWIPFEGTESVIFKHDTNTMIFTGQEKASWFDNVRYMTDQSGFFTVQKDFYADLERQELYFTSPSTDYFFRYYLEKSKGETGDWEMFKLEIADGDYYKNDIKVIVYQNDTYPKGESFGHKESLSLNGTLYSDVYYWQQERRPFELYYTVQLGVVGFKLSSNELWTLQQDSIQ